VLLPPPYWVRNPKTETWSLLDLYRSASFSRSSSLETLGRLGWRTSLSTKSVARSVYTYAVKRFCWNFFFFFKSMGGRVVVRFSILDSGLGLDLSNFFLLALLLKLYSFLLVIDLLYSFVFRIALILVVFQSRIFESRIGHRLLPPS